MYGSVSCSQAHALKTQDYFAAACVRNCQWFVDYFFFVQTQQVAERNDRHEQEANLARKSEDSTRKLRMHLDSELVCVKQNIRVLCLVCVVVLLSAPYGVSVIVPSPLYPFLVLGVWVRTDIAGIGISFVFLCPLTDLLFYFALFSCNYCHCAAFDAASNRHHSTMKISFCFLLVC